MKASRSRFGKALAVMMFAIALVVAAGCSSGASSGGSSGGQSSIEKGQEVYKSAKASCSNCHKVNGQGGAVGPDLSHIATTAAQRKPGMSAKDYIEESLANSGAFVVEGYPNAMPKVNLPEADKENLESYLLSLK